MKIKRSYILGISLLSLLMVVWFVNITNNTLAVDINVSKIKELRHKTRLHSLYLWGNGTWSLVLTWDSNKYLDISEWLIVWRWADWNGSGIVIGWWSGNKVNGKNAWIGGWYENTANWNNSVVGWGSGNNASNGWVVVWWMGNIADNQGVVVWWVNNNADGSVILWWENNQWWQNSLVLWSNAKWLNWSFSWNADNTDSESARIDGDGLIVWSGSLTWVIRLYVDGAVKVNEITNKTWGIWLNGNNCLQGYDGWRYINFWKWWDCGSLGECQFGSVYIQDGDSVTAYAKHYEFGTRGGNCSDKKTLTCNGGKLYEGSSEAENYYTSCYVIDDNPVRTIN